MSGRGRPAECLAARAGAFRGVPRAALTSAVRCVAGVLIVVLAAAGCRDDEPRDVPPGAPVRTVRHFAGETTIVGTPQRVVAFAPLAIESLMAIGIRPVAVTEYGSGGPMQPVLPYPPYMGHLLDGIPTLGSYGQPDLEKAIQFAPDLIVCTDEHMPEHGRIERIAPTLLLSGSASPGDPGSAGWRRGLLTVGEAFGRQDEALRRIAEYDERAARVRERLRATIGDATVLVVRVMAKGFRVSGPSHGTTGDVLYRDLGLRAPAGEDVTWATEYVPLETMVALDPDWILLIEAAPRLNEALLSEPSWKNLRAVRVGHVRSVGFHWIRGHGWYGKMTILDEAAAALAGGD